MSKRMPNKLSGLIEETQKHTIFEALYFMGDTCSFKEEARRTPHEDPLRPTQGKSKRSRLDNGKKNVFDQYTPITTIYREILN